MTTVRLTMAQALVRFLENQWVERDGTRQRFFAGVFGIFGHGNVAGVGEALQQNPRVPYTLVRNEQAMVHMAMAFAKASNRLRTYACTTSVGPGATNMITGAACATINRLPVLLLPGDTFARRNVGPVLQQLESSATQDISVNDCFRPVSRYWDRIQRPEQLLTSLPEVMRVLTSPAETGAVTLALPQDVQAEAFDFPVELFLARTWHVARPRPDKALLQRAVGLIRESRKPIVIAGGGVLYSEATEALARFAANTGIPVAETQAGKGSLAFDHPMNLGAMGVTGTPGADQIAREADLVIGIGTRYSDFTTGSQTAFQNPSVRFVNINVCELDAFKQGGVALQGDARATLEELTQELAGHRAPAALGQQVTDLQRAWEKETDDIHARGHGPLPSQGEVIGVINAFAGPRDVVVGAAGSLPGDLHKLWRARTPGSYHLEYGYSTMGYEIAGGLGVRLADPTREVFVMVGDGSYLMMASEIPTAIQEGIKLIVLVLDNHGFASIGGLSKAVGSDGFGTKYRKRTGDGLTGDYVHVDFAENARSLGAEATRVASIAELNKALVAAKARQTVSVIVIETDRSARVGGYGPWWDVPVAEVSENDDVRAARQRYEDARKNERLHMVKGDGT